MKNTLLKYKMNIDHYIFKYNKLFPLFFNHLFHVKYKNLHIQISSKFETLIYNYIDKTDKDHLFKLYRNPTNNMFYMCIGNYTMYNKHKYPYGNYFIVLVFQSNKKCTKFRFESFKEYLYIEEFVNKYFKVEDENILTNFSNEYILDKE